MFYNKEQKIENWKESEEDDRSMDLHSGAVRPQSMAPKKHLTQTSYGLMTTNQGKSMTRDTCGRFGQCTKCTDAQVMMIAQANVDPRKGRQPPQQILGGQKGSKALEPDIRCKA